MILSVQIIELALVLIALILASYMILVAGMPNVKLCHTVQFAAVQVDGQVTHIQNVTNVCSFKISLYF